RARAVALTLVFGPARLQLARLLLDLRGRLAHRQRPAVAFAVAAQHVIAARVDDDFRLVPVFLLREDDRSRHGAIVQKALDFAEAPIDQLPQRRRDVDVTAGDVYAHESSQLPAASLRLIQYFALVGGGDLELFAIFRDRAARQHEALLLEDADDLRVAERLPRVLVLDDLADALLDRHRPHAVAVRAADPAMEEVLQLEHALRRVHVLVVDDAADGRFVHADVVGHVTQDERPQVLDAVIEEFALEVDDAVRDLLDRLLPLVD